MPHIRATSRADGHARSVSLADENAPLNSLIGPQRSKPTAGVASVASKSGRFNSSNPSNGSALAKEGAVGNGHKHSSSLGGANQIPNRKVLGDVSNATKGITNMKVGTDTKANNKSQKVRKVSSQVTLLSANAHSGITKSARVGASVTVGGHAGKKLAVALKSRSSVQNLVSTTIPATSNRRKAAMSNKKKSAAKLNSSSGAGQSSWTNSANLGAADEYEVLAVEDQEVVDDMEMERVVDDGSGTAIMEQDDIYGDAPSRTNAGDNDENMIIDEEEPVHRIVDSKTNDDASAKLDPTFLNSQDELPSESQPSARMDSDENELSLCPNNVDEQTTDSQDSANWLLLSLEEEEECKGLIETIKRDFQEELDFWDTTMVAEYSEDIFNYMEQLEESTLPNPRYMDSQTEIEWDMRTTLIDWLLQVHMRYHMLPETLWIAVNIIDRFLSKRVVSLVKFQLVGVTAMFVAAKYEEIMAPSVEEFVYMTENGYTREEILKGEKILLTTLDFRISPYCSPYSWLRRISKADDYDIQTRTLSKFLMELTLLDHRFLRAKSSMIAAIGMYTARKMLGGDWSEAFVYYSGYTEAQLITPMTFLIEFLTTEGFESRFVYKKYANRKFLKASVFARNQALKKVREEESLLQSCNESEPNK
ncbi:G2/mitotic-specific cyclin 3 [Phakopsora pachyrhizi]|uniref:G2/mitotic-specific cyclin 3 n=1 Tax=Phakopsora pachyrhizi TaxID=170000 RepID=A0AAV0BRI1_PHAPC|nr:G2/mitotic-specific cyclin 3 [Phakopsora pachyrhizi]CAH7688976.1 G2/mitotic-specific cyclin 3 [Phakopsora pachyrhizi]